MPGFTPRYAIEYPCAGETIDPTVFQTFADDVEAALATVDALSAAALARPNAAIKNTAGQSIAFGAATALTFPTTDFATGVTAAAGGFTILTDGIYMLSLEAGTVSATTSATSWAAEILQAGTVMYRRKISPNPALVTAGFINVVGIISATAGQAITFQWQWTGAGANLSVTSRATINKISTV